MTRDEFIRLRCLVNDMETGLANLGVFLDWIGDTKNRPAQSSIGISALFLPESLIEVAVMAATSAWPEGQLRPGNMLRNSSLVLVRGNGSDGSGQARNSHNGPHPSDTS